MTRLVRWSAPLNLGPARSVVTLGNFDGVHLAHQEMIRRVKARAAPSMRACVVTFEPTPREFFGQSSAPARLMTLTEKHAALRALGVDMHVSVRFDAQVAELTPRAFVERLLHDTLRAQHIVAGHDFRFGHRRSGDVAALRVFGQEMDFAVEQVDAVMLDGAIVASTGVRAALADGRFDHAERLLGRPYVMTGRVVRGQQLGRTLGYPTANIRPRRRRLPLEGVFAVTASDGASLLEHPAVASLGTRPTVNGRGHLLEVHLFDFQGNLYGRRLTVRFVRKIRDEVRFDSLNDLTAQMHRDAREAREALADDAGRRRPDTP
ncbi:MAG: bifunctional riboflavin kinase/FAD synthetase [Pseudomonadota bacterium]